MWSLDQDRLEGLVTSLRGVRFGSAHLVVGYRCDDVTGAVEHCQTFENGELLEWRRGVPDRDVDLWLRQPAATTMAMLGRTELGNRLLCTTEVAERATGPWCDPPPLDEVNQVLGHDLPEVATAGDFTLQLELVSSPFGDLEMFARYRDGRVVERGIGLLPGADALVRYGYADALRLRAGEADIFEVLDNGGHAQGDFEILTVLLGVYESEPFEARRRGMATRFSEPLIRLGEILDSAEWRGIVPHIDEQLDDMQSWP